ncbi:hypothetical protein [Microtetraspora sp. AC03309]|uniref:hypothetical protein n=1 Tax=Microtetraspora sp. AC03309 TaxID=2779376 RepID=UPI001E2A350B|nr:hypothetical protein [Microtetraspora sp. AC03309]
MAVAQLFARDVPELACPEGADLLQVLWCPVDHEMGCPRVLLKWRRSADVVDVIAEQPEPPVMEYGEYLPEPCVLHPERVVEYQYADLLPHALQERIEAWEEIGEHSYQDLSIADGWKAGGWASWHLTDPYPMVCDCGEDMRLLLRVASSEGRRRRVAARRGRAHGHGAALSEGGRADDDRDRAGVQSLDLHLSPVVRPSSSAEHAVNAG